MNERFNEMNELEKQAKIAFIQRHWEILMSIYLGSAERMIKVLLLVNSGGLITILAYLYKQKTPDNINILFKSSLSWFLCGLIATIVIAIIDYVTFLVRQHLYGYDTHNFYGKKQLKFGEIGEFSTKGNFKNWRNWVPIIILPLGCASIAFAAIGICKAYSGFMLN